MVRECLLCKTSTYRVPDLTFHRFTQNPTLKKRWLSALDLDENEEIPTSAFICMQHFTDNDFYVKPSGLKTLKSGAVPLPLNVENITATAKKIRKNLPESRKEPPDLAQKSSSANSTAASETETSFLCANHEWPYWTSITLTASRTEHVMPTTVTSDKPMETNPPSQPDVEPGQSETTDQKKRKYEDDDLASEDFVTLRSRLRCTGLHTQLAEEETRIQKERMKTLQSELWRLKAKVTSLDVLLELLDDNFL